MAGDGRRGDEGPCAVLASLLDLALPRRCAGCGAEGSAVCGACRSELEQDLRAGPVPARPVPAPAALPPAMAATGYAGAARGLVLAHKERGRADLVVPLGLLLAGAVDAAAPPGRYAVVAVPTTPAARRRRGRDPLRAITESAVAALRDLGRDPVAVRLLRVSGRPQDQVGLGGAERAANLAGVLAARGHDPGIPVVLVDDVLTTGATLAEAARAVRATGAQVHGAAVVAATVVLTATSLTPGPPLGLESS